VVRAGSQSWSIVGKDLISEVTCSEPYEWSDPTGAEWEFNEKAQARAGKEPFHVSACSDLQLCGGFFLMVSAWWSAHVMSM